MEKWKILTWLTTVLIALILLVSGWFLFFSNSHQDKSDNKSLPNIKELTTLNLPGKIFGPTQPDRAENLDPSEILKLTNEYRKADNLPLLNFNSLLNKAADKKVSEMFDQQYFEHNSPSGQTPAELVTSVGYKYKVAGENLALGNFKNEKDLVDAWMNSPGHRANILNKDYTEIGIAVGLDVFEDRGQTWLAVQEFGRPAPNCTLPNSQDLENIQNKKQAYQNLINQVDAIYNSKPLNETKINQINALQTQIESLYNEIQDLVNSYNQQVNVYNTCIEK